MLRVLFLVMFRKPGNMNLAKIETSGSIHELFIYDIVFVTYTVLIRWRIFTSDLKTAGRVTRIFSHYLCLSRYSLSSFRGIGNLASGSLRK
jgi:hypothetical protein